MRVLLFSGKGGVGKTTLAAATALRAAQDGRRVALLSSDPAHSLADALEQPIGPSWAQVATRVDAREISVLRELERSWGAIHDWLCRMLLDAGGVAAEEVLVLPGLEELVALRAVGETLEGGRHDLCIVDCAPTAATLRMLRLPEVLDLLMDRVWSWKRRAAGTLRRVAKPVGAGDLVAPEDAFDAFERLVADVDAVRSLLMDPSRTSVRLVTQPRDVVVDETRRAWSYLCLHGIHTDALLVNRVLSDEVRSPRFAAWRAQEARQLDVIARDFPLTTLHVPLVAPEPRGPESLLALGDALYRDRDPAQVLTGASPLRFESGAEGPRLRLRIPHAVPETLDVARRGDVLDIENGLARRRVALPDSVAACDHGAATLEGGELTVAFARPAPS